MTNVRYEYISARAIVPRGLLRDYALRYQFNFDTRQLAVASSSSSLHGVEHPKRDIFSSRVSIRVSNNTIYSSWSIVFYN